jgi:2,3-bisphosphoglycerate-independent phosphoglycerate mutase
MQKANKAILVILDGWGYREEKEYNAIFEAETPYFDYLLDHHPHTLLDASGESVGLPQGQMGNSEVGHSTIGAGRVIYTDFVKISKAMKDGSFEENNATKILFNHIKEHNSTLHITGLIGSGGVHAHSEHLFGILKAAKGFGLTKIAIHAFTDGRDTPPQSASTFLAEIEKMISKVGIGFIASISGRFYAMDRDNNWNRLEKVEKMIFEGVATESKEIPSNAISKSYEKNIVDEHLEPIIFLDTKNQKHNIQKNDGVIFFNFRSDRAKMLTQKILEKKTDMNLCLVTMTEYDKDFDALVAFPPEEVQTTLAAEIEKCERSQSHIAETEKFAHATYFLNGGKKEPHNHENHILVPSRKDIETHDLAPEMQAKMISKIAIKEINKGIDFIFINYANTDMVGHTANKDALFQAIACVDHEIKKITNKALLCGYDVLITADHGNAELYFDEKNNEKHTAHTTSKVPFVYISSRTKENQLASTGSLADIAPTILNILGIDPPKSMTGRNLIQ